MLEALPKCSCLKILGLSRAISFTNKEPENGLDHADSHAGSLVDFEFPSELMGCLLSTPNVSYLGQILQRRAFQSVIWKVRILLPVLWGLNGKEGWMSLDSRFRGTWPRHILLWAWWFCPQVGLYLSV